MRSHSERVVVLGASDKQERYAYKAFKMLLENGHTVLPVSTRLTEIEGTVVYPSIKEVPAPIDTVTLYVSADVSTKLINDIVTLQPKRVIFNPGAENQKLAEALGRDGLKPLKPVPL